jgi:hypothetical protein
MNFFKKSALVLVAVLSISGCAQLSAFKNFLPSGWDSNEMLWIAEMQYDIRKIQCEGGFENPLVYPSVEKVWRTKEILWWYAQANRHADVVELIRPFSESMEGIYMTAKKGIIREPYCVNKVIILTVQVDEIAEALASRRKR